MPMTLDMQAPPSGETLSVNLSALARRCPTLAEKLAATPPRHGLEFFTAGDGALSGACDGRLLASRRWPLEEARRLAGTLDPKTSGCALVMGFGMGYHVQELHRRMNEVGVVAVYEPDLGMLRAVLERIDCSAWLGSGGVAIFDDPADKATISLCTQGWEAPLAVGVQIIQHPASIARVDAGAGVFAESFSQVVATLRTHIITTMMQTDVTVRNLLMNAGHYAGRPGIGELAGIGAGRLGIVVSAGPSLRRNIAVLREACRNGLRDRCVIVCVQTVLKQLLAEGIRPHFVTALDYHEISRRFYEGLTAEDVRGVTLVAEPKANPAILDAYPANGSIRLIEDSYLEQVIGEELGGRHTPLRPGATVAHLAYYLARFLGCDPVVMVGQDLAFTDGQYYAKGAAIHQTWAAELNAFNTLEMLEWQRIARMRGNLHEAKDVLGRKVYTDDQMAAYLAQFERDFMDDERRGLTTIDATEGGVRKAHTITGTLADTIERFGHASPTPLVVPECPIPDRRQEAALKARLASLRSEVRQVARISRETRDLLGKTARSLDEPAKANRLIAQIHSLRDRVEAIRPAYPLVQRLNQTGTFKRFRADRLIALEPGLTPRQRQRRQVERDSMNVGWLADVADVLDDLLDASIKSLDGAPKRNRDVLPTRPDAPDVENGPNETPKAVRTAAVLMLDLDAASHGGGAARTVAGRTALGLTLERLSRCEKLDHVVIVSDHPDRARALAGRDFKGLDVRFHTIDMTPLRERMRAVAPARLWARASWRGGIANLTAYDEVFDPSILHAAMEATEIDAALVVGADWCCIDPALCDAVIERHAESPWAHPLTFTQASPGLCGVVVSRPLAAELARGETEGAPGSSIGGVLGFNPLQPRTDMIAHPCCVPVPPPVRDACRRFIPGSHDWPDVERAMVALGPDATAYAALQLVELLAGAPARAAMEQPAELIIEICSTRATMGAELAARILRSFARTSPLGVTLLGSGGADPLAHPELHEIVSLARSIGGVHIRTPLTADDPHLAGFMTRTLPSCDVVSVDVIANTAETFRLLQGNDGYERLLQRADALLKSRRTVGGMTLPWVVGRITRRDEVYEEIEAFYDKWMLLGGWAVIDQHVEAGPEQRIQPLGKPPCIARRDWRSRLVIGADGCVFADERTILHPEAASCDDPVGHVFREGVLDVWRRLLEQRERVHATSGAHEHPDLWTGW